MDFKYKLLITFLTVIVILYIFFSSMLYIIYYNVSKIIRKNIKSPIIIKYIKYKYDFIDECISKTNNWVFSMKQKNGIFKYFRLKTNLMTELQNYSNIAKYNISPKIIRYNISEKYIIYEKLDTSLYVLFTTNKLDNKHINALIDLLKKYSNIEFKHKDLHLYNFMWDNKTNTFKLIDWEYNYEINKRNYDIPDTNYIKYFLNLCIHPNFISKNKKRKYTEFQKVKKIKLFFYNYFVKIFKEQKINKNENKLYSEFISIIQNEYNIPSNH